MAAGGKVTVYSAGIESHGVNPQAVAVMKEDGVDISGHTSNLVDDYKGIDFDFIITVCDSAKENCPYIASHGKRFHMNFSDPAKAIGTPQEVLAQFRKVRDEIKKYCYDFVADNLN
jgi:arsenate reductase (thioredoxin)